MDIVLNKQQEEAKDLIVNWFTNYRETKKQTFVLAGYAGTGKTFLINYIAEHELKLNPYEVAFGTPTGKAASVLIQRGRDAATIHRLIYTPVETELETKLDGEVVKSKGIEFVKKPTIPNYKLIVLDEISMVEEEIMKDLLSFGIPILCTGDIGQLPAIFKSNDLLSKPDYTLTEIVRQALDNPIIQLATMARNKVPIPYGSYGKDVVVINQNSLSQVQLKNLLLKADQVICGTNATRNYLNTQIRKFRGIDVIKDKLPVEGDKVICTVNNWELYLDEDNKYNLVNGTIGYTSMSTIKDKDINLGSFTFRPDFLELPTEEILFDYGIFTNQEFSYDMHQKVYSLPDDKYVLRESPRARGDTENFSDYRERILKYIKASRSSLFEKMINRFEYAYAISCHKAQGSEFDKVILFDEGFMFKEPEKWLYTGITRAKKKLVIIR